MSDTPNLSTESTLTNEGASPLVRHTRCESWGRGLILWERENKRGCQFEDGHLRIIAEPYFDLLQPARKPDPALRQRLRRQAIANGFQFETGEQTTTGRTRTKAAAPRPTVEDQMTVFEELYPKGFHGQAWIEATRAREGRPLKRHRDHAIAVAAERLDKDVLVACIAAGRYGEVFDRVLEVVAKTDLATRTQLDPFADVGVDEELAKAMLGYLHDIRAGDLATMARLRRAFARHGIKKITWNALTAPRALLYPGDHMCVRASVMRAQAKLLMPGFKLGPQPSAADYSRCLEMAMSVREQLTKHDFAPRDLFDVTKFMHVTLSPKAKDALNEAMDQRRAVATRSA